MGLMIIAPHFGGVGRGQVRAVNGNCQHQTSARQPVIRGHSSSEGEKLVLGLESRKVLYHVALTTGDGQLIGGSRGWGFLEE